MGYVPDAIYIDANHTYEAAKQDIELWYPKVRKGGMICGHDYLPKHLFENRNDKDIPIYFSDSGVYAGMFGVNGAVDEFTEECSLEVKISGTQYIISI